MIYTLQSGLKRQIYGLHHMFFSLLSTILLFNIIAYIAFLLLLEYLPCKLAPAICLTLHRAPCPPCKAHHLHKLKAMFEQRLLDLLHIKQPLLSDTLGCLSSFQVQEKKNSCKSVTQWLSNLTPEWSVVTEYFHLSSSILSHENILKSCFDTALLKRIPSVE